MAQMASVRCLGSLRNSTAKSRIFVRGSHWVGNRVSGLRVLPGSQSNSHGCAEPYLMCQQNDAHKRDDAGCTSQGLLSGLNSLSWAQCIASSIFNTTCRLRKQDAKLKDKENQHKKAVAAQQKAEARAVLTTQRFVRNLLSCMQSSLKASSLEMEAQLTSKNDELKQSEALDVT